MAGGKASGSSRSAAGGADVKQGQWTAEEDKLLASWQAKMGNRWSAVAQHMPGRTGQQCAQRWRHKVNPFIRKDKWTEEEDKKLSALHKEFGNKWAEIARRLEGRTDQQCMGRWRRHLDPTIKKESWSTDEDQRLIELHKTHGSSWAQIATKIQGRTAQQCRARFFQMQCWDADRQASAAPTSNVAQAAAKAASLLAEHPQTAAAAAAAAAAAEQYTWLAQLSPAQQAHALSPAAAGAAAAAAAAVAANAAHGQGVQGVAKQEMVSEAMQTYLATPKSIQQMAAALATLTPGSLLGPQQNMAAALWSAGMFLPPSAGGGAQVQAAGAVGGAQGAGVKGGAAMGTAAAGAAAAAARSAAGILRMGAQPPTPSAVLSTPGTGVLNHLLGVNLPSDSPPTPPNLFAAVGDGSLVGLGNFTPPDGAGGSGGAGSLGSGGSGSHRLSLGDVTLPRSLDKSPGATGSTPGSTGKSAPAGGGSRKRGRGGADENGGRVNGSPDPPTEGSKRRRGEPAKLGEFATPALAAKTKSAAKARRGAHVEEDISPDALLPSTVGTPGGSGGGLLAPATGGSGGSVDETRSRLHSLLDGVQ